MMKKMLKDKPDSDFTPEDRALLDAVENGADLTDRRFIEPVVRAVRET